MKRFLSILLVLLLCSSFLIACNDGNADVTDSGTESASEQNLNGSEEPSESESTEDSGTAGSEITEISSISELVAIGNAKGNNEYTTEEYAVKGIIVEFGNTDSAKQYGNFYIEDESGNRIYVYGLTGADGKTRFDKLNPQPKIGDTVTIKGVVGKYNGNPQLKETKLIELTELDTATCTHKYNADCDTVCNLCNAERSVTIEHTFDNACDAKCNECDAERTPSEHVYDNVCDNECNICGYIRNVGAHTDSDGNEKCDVCDKILAKATGESLAIFEFGGNLTDLEPDKNGYTGKDGSPMKESSASYSVNGHTLTFTNISKVFTKAYDAKGNSTLKLGTSNAIGTFEFVVSDDVNSVVINVAKYKTYDTTVAINGKDYIITKQSNDGEYEAITIDTTTTKKIEFSTVSGKGRCMIDSIEFRG